MLSVGRHSEDVFLSRGDPGHPLFTELSVSQWVACELARLAMIPHDPYQLGSPSPYYDDLPPDEQARVRHENPMAYLQGLSPPLRTAVIFAVDQHRHGQSLSLKTAWIQSLLHKVGTRDFYDDTSQLRSRIQHNASMRNLRNSRLNHDEMRMTHTWDAYRIAFGPKPLYNSDLPYPCIDTHGLCPFDSMNGEFTAFDASIDAKADSELNLWTYHLMDWAILNILQVHSSAREKMETRFDIAFEDVWGKSDDHPLVQEVIREHPWAVGFTRCEPTQQQVSSIADGYLQERQVVCAAWTQKQARSNQWPQSPDRQR